jgi:hypothetical protein
MYILSISVSSSEKYFNTQCYSNPIRVAKMPSSSSLTNSTNNNNNEPSSSNQNNKNYVLRFKAIDTISFTLDEANKIRASIYNCMENYNISATNLELTSNHDFSSTSSSSSSSSRRRRRRQSNNNITIITLTFYSSNSNPTFINNLSKLNISDILIFVSATINGVTYGDEKSVNI